MSKDYSKRLQNLVKELFELDDLESLDFGIHRIMGQKQKKIEQFIEEDLIEAVEKEFEEYVQVDKEETKKEIEEIKDKIKENIGEDAFTESGEIREEYRDTPIAQRFYEKKESLKESELTQQHKAEIYSKIYHFFNRYYKDGDFILQMRYGQGNEYAIPYNGEEVALYWANKDQYYIKTGEYYKNYSFELGEYTVSFRLAEANEKQNNNKSNDRYFILKSEEPVNYNEDEQELIIYFEHREISDEEREKYGPSYIKLHIKEEVLEVIPENIPSNTLKNLLQKEDDSEKSVLEKHIDRYTSKNTRDFFIHNDLRGFLEQELNYYLNHEILNLEDIEESRETEIQRYMSRIKVIRKISEKIIDFLSQIEEFQKKLWEKKKFVVHSDYCITLDKIPEKFYSEIAKNEDQLKEWKDLYKLEEISEGTLFQGNDGEFEIDENFLKNHPYMMVDTKLFDDNFKSQILESFENLDDETDGVLIKSENWQALNLLKKKYREDLKFTYVDPPYNTKLSELPFKDNYRRSSWLSMMKDRLDLTYQLLQSKGVLFTSIDDNLLQELRELHDMIFNKPNRIDRGMVIWNNQGSTKGFKKIVKNHEYILAYSKNEEEVINHFGDNFPEECGKVEHYCFNAPSPKNPTADVKFKKGTPIKNAEEAKFEGEVGGEVTLEIVSGDMVFKNGKLQNDVVLRGSFPYKDQIKHYYESDEPTYDTKGQKWEEIFFNSNGMPRYWKYKNTKVFDSVQKELPNYGSSDLKKIFGKNPYKFPKPVALVKKLLKFFTTSNDLILDPVGGSGTTAQAVIEVNREDSNNRKYLMFELKDYFETIIKPRVKKSVFSSDWKEGVPQKHDGTSHMFKYMYLEQYEDTLNNIEFVVDGEVQKKLEDMDDYLLHYMLDYESRDNPARLDIDQLSEPFSYKLKIGGVEEKNKTKVNLVETFNYLIGLHVQKMREIENERQYKVVYGKKGEENIVVIWRNTKELDLEEDKNFIEENILGDFDASKIYVNGECFVENSNSIEREFKNRMGA